MIGRRSVIGIALAFALAICAFAAANASAEQRAFLCEANTTTGAEQFSDAHCKVAATGNVGFKHTAIADGVATNITGTNAKTASGTTAAEPGALEGTLSGVETTLMCTTVSAAGSLTNAAASVSGTLTIAFSGCTVAKPSGQGCIVTGGTITTESLAATTVGQTTNNVKFSPISGTKIATIPISGCATEALNKNFPLTGSLVATASGATWTITEAGVTTQNTLKFGGNKAGLGGVLTISKASTTSALNLT